MTRYERMMLTFRRFLKSTNLYSRELMLKNCTNTESRYLPTHLSCTINGNLIKEDAKWLKLFSPYALEDITTFAQKHYRITLSHEETDTLKLAIQNYIVGKTLLKIVRAKGVLTDRLSLDNDLRKFLVHVKL